MFNLENALTEWRRQMKEAGVRNPATLDELENHLREDLERASDGGVFLDQSFRLAVKRLGQPDTLQTEFDASRAKIQDRTKNFLLMLANHLNPNLAFNMNASNLNLESRRATYLKAGAFLLPAVFVWGLCAIFVLPKVQEMCLAAGMTVFHYQQAPLAFTFSAIMGRAIAFVGQALIFVTSHDLAIGGIVAAALILLEVRSAAWPRFRRATLGAGVFILNFAVLVSLLLMVISAVIAAPSLGQHIK